MTNIAKEPNPSGEIPTTNLLCYHLQTTPSYILAYKITLIPLQPTFQKYHLAYSFFYKRFLKIWLEKDAAASPNAKATVAATKPGGLIPK
ncbi:MAG: hypothetical protein CM15mP65_10080 [Crocinitomicaceae bacterium]|nr:MAG: hypothetical protein CM15mP65_10080 [Crocinitomicaceae bacterium]